jgi:hypothetical protein
VVKGITGGSLDYLINNAAVVSHVSEFKTLGDLYVSITGQRRKKC